MIEEEDELIYRADAGWTYRGQPIHRDQAAWMLNQQGRRVRATTHMSVRCPDCKHLVREVSVRVGRWFWWASVRNRIALWRLRRWVAKLRCDNCQFKREHAI